MALELLKIQMEDMNIKIAILTSDINKKTVLIENLNIEYIEITNKLEEEKTILTALEENKKYLIDVKNETESNYKQINDAASTLLEILKSKTDKI
jgi:hypothetical protein